MIKNFCKMFIYTTLMSLIIYSLVSEIDFFRWIVISSPLNHYFNTCVTISLWYDYFRSNTFTILSTSQWTRNGWAQIIYYPLRINFFKSLVVQFVYFYSNSNQFYCNLLVGVISWILGGLIANNTSYLYKL